MRWLRDGSVGAVRGALRRVAPALAEEPIELTARPIPAAATEERRVSTPPPFRRGTALVGGRYMAKFAWSAEAAIGVERERVVLPLLRRLAPDVPLPEVVHSSPDPLIFTTRYVGGRPLGLAPDEATAEQVGRVLAALHTPSVRDGMRRDGVDLAETVAQATTSDLRSRFVGTIVHGRLAADVERWCDWVDDVLAEPPAAESLVHGDLHGHNLVVDETGRRLELVVDLEQVAIGDPSFDLRYAVSIGPDTRWMARCHAAHVGAGGTDLAIERIAAWHVLTALGDATWRTERGVPLPVGGTPEGAVADVARRLGELGVGPV